MHYLWNVLVYLRISKLIFLFPFIPALWRQREKAISFIVCEIVAQKRENMRTIMFSSKMSSKVNIPRFYFRQFFVSFEGGFELIRVSHITGSVSICLFVGLFKYMSVCFYEEERKFDNNRLSPPFDFTKNVITK